MKRGIFGVYRRGVIFGPEWTLVDSTANGRFWEKRLCSRTTELAAHSGNHFRKGAVSGKTA